MSLDGGIRPSGDILPFHLDASIFHPPFSGDASRSAVRTRYRSVDALSHQRGNSAPTWRKIAKNPTLQFKQKVQSKIADAILEKYPDFNSDVNLEINFLLEDKTFLPSTVDILSLNPCLFFLFLFDG